MSESVRCNIQDESLHPCGQKKNNQKGSKRTISINIRKYQWRKTPNLDMRKLFLIMSANSSTEVIWRHWSIFLEFSYLTQMSKFPRPTGRMPTQQQQQQQQITVMRRQKTKEKRREEKRETGRTVPSAKYCCCNFAVCVSSLVIIRRSNKVSVALTRTFDSSSFICWVTARDVTKTQSISVRDACEGSRPSTLPWESTLKYQYKISSSVISSNFLVPLGWLEMIPCITGCTDSSHWCQSIRRGWPDSAIFAWAEISLKIHMSLLTLHNRRHRRITHPFSLLSHTNLAKVFSHPSTWTFSLLFCHTCVKFWSMSCNPLFPNSRWPTATK